MVRYNYKELLDKDPNFKKWYENIWRGSPASADGKLRRVSYVAASFAPSAMRKRNMAKAARNADARALPI